MPDVFVSYSRHDGAFVHRLVASIEDRGKQVWLDTDGIADAEVFPAAIKRAIEQSDAFLFVITPAAVRLGLLRERGRVRQGNAEADRAGAA